MRCGLDDSTRLGGRETQYRVGVYLQTQLSLRQAGSLVRMRTALLFARERDGGYPRRERVMEKDGMGLSAGTRRDVCDRIVQPKGGASRRQAGKSPAGLRGRDAIAICDGNLGRPFRLCDVATPPRGLHSSSCRRAAGIYRFSPKIRGAAGRVHRDHPPPPAVRLGRMTIVLTSILLRGPLVMGGYMSRLTFAVTSYQVNPIRGKSRRRRVTVSSIASACPPLADRVRCHLHARIRRDARLGVAIQFLSV
jgi:hypothetical protein